MKLSYQWLQEYIDLTESPEELGELITMHIAEVEQVTDLATNLQLVVVGEVLEAKDHPNADKLHIGTFDVGETDDQGNAKPRQIVFGGKALLKVGQKLPIALPGAVVGPITIAQRKLRGEISAGMCCLNSELGILNQAEEIHLFDADVPNGTLVREALGLNDAIIEIDNKTLTHRGDLFNHIGFARELSVVLDRPLRVPDLLTHAHDMSAATKPLPLTITIDDPEICRRYIGAALTNVTVGPSPNWMQTRLSALGVSTINNVVDITNYVMLEYGQPLHAFNYDHIKKSAIHVRYAKPSEHLATLDGKMSEFKDVDHIPVIADAKTPHALAGIMGGTDSEITNDTTTIVLESANFNPVIIRKAAQALAKRTEGSTRHEKNLGLIFPEYGFYRAIQLFQELCGAHIASEIIDLYAVTQDQDDAAIKLNIELDCDFASRLIGEPVSIETVQKILTGLDFTVEVLSDTVVQVTPPSARMDVTNQQDLVEEIARMRGYDAITPKPLLGSLEPPQNELTYDVGNTVIQTMTQVGAREIYSYSFYSATDMERLGLDPATHLEMQNPMNPEQQYLRQTLLIQLLNAVQLNQRNHYASATLVEYGHVYFPDNEFTVVAGVVYGDSTDVFSQAKGYVEHTFTKLHVDYTFQTISNTAEHDNQNYRVFDSSADAAYFWGEKQLATVGLIQPSITNQFSITGWVAYFTIHIPRLGEAHLVSDPQAFKPLSAYPQIDLDISIEVDDAVEWNALYTTIHKSGQPLIKKIELFDLYQGGQLAPGKKSLGIRMWFGSMERTLEMTEAEQAREQIINALRETHHAEHRF